VAKQIIEAHGSRMTVESQSGKGSTFRFTLPAVT
jgi:signal transduction histidine kinase